LVGLNPMSLHPGRWQLPHSEEGGNQAVLTFIHALNCSINR
jgi:hypothetical protein